MGYASKPKVAVGRTLKPGLSMATAAHQYPIRKPARTSCWRDDTVSPRQWQMVNGIDAQLVFAYSARLIGILIFLARCFFIDSCA
jgi:hypothetical protein